MPRTALLITALVPCSAAALLAGLFLGAAPLSPHEVIAALLHPNTTGDANTIVWSLRVPRLCSAAVVGTCLALAGFLMQGMLRNPLVDPYLTGVSAGAGAAVAIAISVGTAFAFIPGVGFIAGLATAALVALLGRRSGRLDAERLILAGVSLSSLFAAIIALVLTRTQPGNASGAIVNWLAGSLAGRGWPEIGWSAPYAALGIAAAIALAAPLNALRLGDTRAAALGLNVQVTQWSVLAAAALLTAAAVSLAGIVGFAGLIVPHVARRLVGTDARVAIPAAALIGPACIALADTLGRTIVAPLEIPLGVVLAFIGVPTFLYLYLSGGRGAWR